MRWLSYLNHLKIITGGKKSSSMFYSRKKKKRKQCLFETAVFYSHMQKCTNQLQLTQIPYTSHLDSFFKQTHTRRSRSAHLWCHRQHTESRRNSSFGFPIHTLQKREGVGRPRSPEQGQIVCQPKGGYHMATDCARVQQAITNQTFLLRCLKMPFKLLQCWASFRRKILSGW